MLTSCPSCGADTFPGARFCRRCGAPLHAPGGETGDVSPHAATVPLIPDETRTTDGLAPGEERVAPQTSRVSLAEMERLLRSQEGDGQQPSQTIDPEATLVRNNSAVTRPDVPGYEDEELTIHVPRPVERQEPDFEATGDFDATRPFDPEATMPAGVGSWPYARAAGAEANEPKAETGEPKTADADVQADAPVNAPPPVPPRPAPARRAWPWVVAVCVFVAALTAGGAWLGYRLLRRSDLTDLPTQGPTAPVTGDARQQFELKLQDAEARLAAGDMEGALGLLREANALDPGNTRAHRRLGELLLSANARREAIEEFRAVALNAPYDFNAWRVLATTQFAEGLYADAAESYRRAVNLTAPGARPDPNDLLGLADSLRMAGRADEARAAYEQLLSFAPAELAELARRHLSELSPAQATPTPAHTPRPGEPSPTPQAEEVASVNATPAPTPAPEPTAQPSPTPATPAPAPMAR